MNFMDHGQASGVASGGMFCSTAFLGGIVGLWLPLVTSEEGGLLKNLEVLQLHHIWCPLSGMIMVIMGFDMAIPL